MITITLPDNSKKEFASPVSCYEVAKSIGTRLAKSALGAKVNDKLVDLSHQITQDCDIAIITEKDPEGIDLLRHSCAHLLAQAVQSVYPKAQVTIGPVIKDGFYYDFAYDKPFTPEDLELFEKKMADLVKQDLKVERSTLTREEAIEKFSKMGENYKVEIIKDLPEGEQLSFYQQGDFVDLCRGPHVPSTGKIQAFKLLKLAGAYWRGDSNNEMLQRVYGTCWPSKKELKAYLTRLEEAQKRDHRKIAKKLDLFHIQDLSPGMIFWHANGWSVYQNIVQYMRNVWRQNDYQEINTPEIVDRLLWEKSGHWEMFQNEMFSVETEGRTYAVKPMNCPCHVQVYNQGIKSYRDLPLRLAEFGACHRNEPSGALHGLMRVRGFVQDDAHIFCTEEQIQSEVSSFIKLLFKVYKDFGFDNIQVKLSTRPEKRVGSDEIWDKAEKALETALNAEGLDWELFPGEGAFYGPKIEFSLEDCLERVWQCGTIQVDFSMPTRLDAEYVAEDGQRKTPVMLHRAILGSIERFIGIMLENTAGSLPTWLAPTQAVIMNITDSQVPYIEKVAQNLTKFGIRATTDLRNEKISFKIREHTIKRVPYLLVVGDKEVSEGTLSVRTRTGEDLGSLTPEQFITRIEQECQLAAQN